MGKPLPSEPSLVRASDLPEADIGTCVWDCGHTELLALSNGGQTITWHPRKPESLPRRLWRQLVRKTDCYPPAWVPAPTQLRLHSGSYRWDFVVEEMASGQIGVGFMLLWDVGPDWGFFGYLGASPSAWAYDPSTGDVVCNTESIQGNLPKFGGRHTGTVSVHLDLPRHAAGVATFRACGVDANPIPLPESAVVVPAACLLRETQSVSLENLDRK